MPSIEHRLPLQWSVFADRMLRQRACTMDAVSLALSLGRTPMEVRARALALGVEFKGESSVMDRAWGSGEVSFLRQQYRRMPVAEIARQLGRSSGAVQSKIWSLGLRKRRRSQGDPVEPDPAFSAGALDALCPGPDVPLIEAAERRMEADAMPESAPWLEPEAEAVPEEQIGENKNEPEISAVPPASQMSVKQPAQPFRWWTADEDERLRQFVKDKTPLPELAELFSRSEAEIARRIARVCAEPDPAVQAQNQRWGYGRTRKKAKTRQAGPIPEERLASMSKMDLLRTLAGLA